MICHAFRLPTLPVCKINSEPETDCLLKSRGGQVNLDDRLVNNYMETSIQGNLHPGKQNRTNRCTFRESELAKSKA